MEVRRAVQLTGGSSFTVTLPKEWVERMGLSKGSQVIIKPSEDGGLYIYPDTPVSRRVSKVEIMFTDDINQLLVGAYLYGYDTIRIVSETSITDTQLEEVRRIVRGLVGAEIVDEADKSVEVQIVLNEETVAPEKLLRRQYNLVIGMVEYAVNSVVTDDLSLGRMAVTRDEEVDRLYFTLVRVLRSALVDPALAKRLNITPLNLLDLRVAAKFIEDAGDQAAEMAKEKLRNRKPLAKEVKQEFRKLANIVLSIGFQPIDALFSHEIALVTKVTGLRSEFMKHSEDFLKRMPGRSDTASLYKFHFHLARVCEDLADVAELSLPIKPIGLGQT
ncbi:MAG: phosphate uptake regulator PhoU [Candidatus Caldarchaeum sp.]